MVGDSEYFTAENFSEVLTWVPLRVFEGVRGSQWVSVN